MRDLSSTLPVQRLTPQELMMLRAEDAGWREDIGAIGTLDGGALAGADGEIDLLRVRATIAARLHLVPRFRQVLRVPRWWAGRPFWIDAPDFRLEQHVRTSPLPPGAGDDELLAAVEKIRARPFATSRPLWELWLLPGLADGRVGLYVKLHHSIADGVVGVAQVVAFLDLDETATVDPAPPWRPDPVPTTSSLIVQNVRDLLTHFGRWLSGLAHPVTFVRDLVVTARMLRETIGKPAAPATSVNRPIGDDRVVKLLRSGLDTFDAVGRQHDATVNDVLMAAVAGGYRELLSHRAEDTDVTLVASVPVSLHGKGAGDELTNDDGMIFVPLPVGIEDPARRLDVVAESTTELKRHVNRPPTSLLLSARVAQDRLWRAFEHQRWSNAYVANVPGTPQPLFLAGARLLEVFPLVPIMGNLTLGVGAMSYDGQFNITVVADRVTCPDVDMFVRGMASTLDRLVEHEERTFAPVPPGPRPPE